MTASETIIRYAGFIFAVTYVGIGIAVLVRYRELTPMLNGYSIPFGILFILYGLFRGYRVYHRYF